MDNDSGGATSAADQPSPTRSWSWMTATIFSIVLGLSVALLMTTAMFWIGDYYRGSEAGLQEQRKQKLQELSATEQKELTTYGWVNQSNKTVRVPINRAMQLLVDEGGFTPPPPAETAEKKTEEKPADSKKETKKPGDDASGKADSSSEKSSGENTSKAESPSKEKPADETKQETKEAETASPADEPTKE